MCGRYTLRNPEELVQRFGLQDLSESRIGPPRFNAAPSQMLPVVHARDGSARLEDMRWGFQPGWLKGDGKRPPPINARAESLLERALFRSALARHRCLVPSDGYYEWQASDNHAKQPFFIRRKDDELFGFAGLWTWSDEVGPSYAIITTGSNGVTAALHHRMPVILRPEDEALWLDSDVTDPREVLALLQPFPDEEIEAYLVSTLVNNVRNQGPELIQPSESGA